MKITERPEDISFAGGFPAPELFPAEQMKKVSDMVLITTGSQQGLDLTGKVFIDEGDMVICEKPTYLAAINVFNAYLPNFADVGMDEDGMIMEELEECLKANPNAKEDRIVEGIKRMAEAIREVWK